MYIISFMINWTITCCRIACHYKQDSSSEISRNLGTNFIGSNNVTLLFYITFNKLNVLCYFLSVIAFHWYNMIQLIQNHFGKTLCNKELWSPAVQRLVQQKKRKRACGWIGHMLRRSDRYIAKRALEQNPQTKCNGGRPQHTCGQEWQSSWRNSSHGRKQTSLLKQDHQVAATRGQPIFQQAQINPLVTNILFI